MDHEDGREEPFLTKALSRTFSFTRNQSNDPHKPKYKNLPRRNTSLNLDPTVSWKEFPDRFIVTNIPDKALPDNSIQTTKYTWLTFLPKNMYEQFSKLANLYFLIIGILQMIEPISSSGGKPVTYLPLAVIITISAIKDLFEDLERRRSDSRENNSETLRLTEHGFEKTNWEDLHVGDIIKVENGKFLPADIIVLKSSEADGGCYIETKNLDGETNLKFKSAEKTLLEYYENEHDLWQKRVEANFEKQNPNLYNFTGSLKLDDDKTIPLDNKNFLLRACSMRSDYAIGLVAYTGHHTKIMLNSVKARPKSSRLEKIMNKQIILLVFLQSVWCLLSSIYATIWFHTEEDSVFGQDTDQELKAATKPGVYFIEGFGSWIILFTNFIPISLLVTLEMVKFIQAILVHRDDKMIDNVTHSRATVYTSRLMEEIGQVAYIFSDKTGTLTCNVMEFKKLSVFAKSYGENKDEKFMESQEKVDNVDFGDKEFFDILENEGHQEHKDAKEVVFLLSICHSANLETRDGVTKYSASSPDDLAFVNFAKLCGYEYFKTDEKNDIILKIHNEEKKIKLLHQIEFSSERKMMSVIFENDEGEIVMYSKGADSAILEKMDKSKNPKIEEIKKQVHKYACEGFRTLLLAKRVIPKDIYEDWSKKYEEASCKIQDREEEMFKCQQEIEKEFIVVGATAIEDKLQDEVDETIFALKKAGIKVWVLTGDKIETAINIGYSCKLLDDKQEVFTIDVTNKEELNDSLEGISKQIYKKKLGKKGRPYAIVITGYSLVDSFNPHVRNAASEKLFKIFSEADVVVGCRVSPKQKKDVVELVKTRLPTTVTLAIGDGANDVNMITAAHVGVGIKGLEGYQAARASDFAIGEFKILRRLLLYYGRETYRKNSYLVLYNFWKNVLLILPLFWFGFWNGMSGALLYDSFIYQFFNLFYASVPIIIFAVTDKEHKGEFLEKHPEHYTPGIHDRYFNYKLFWYWFSSASIQSIFIALTSFGALCATFVNQEGQILDFWNAGMMTYSSVVICANFKILLFTHRFNVLVAFGTLASIAFYTFNFYVFNLISLSSLYQQFSPLYTTWSFYIGTALMITMTTFMDKAVTTYENEECLANDPKTSQLKKQTKEKEM